MDAKHYILKCHLNELQDHINDGWCNYEKAKNLKDLGEDEESRNFLTKAKKRADDGSREVEEISSFTKKHDIDTKDNAFSSLYDGVLYRLDELHSKIEKMRI